MGKRGKKKAGSVLKEKRAPVTPPPRASSPRTVTQPSIPSIETLDDGSLVVKEKKVACPHLDKGIDLGKVSTKVGSSEPFRCEDCREGAADRRASKGKGKHGKKKGGGSAVSKSGSKALWICLECGHVSCGGAGFPTTPQSHAVRHSKQTRHPLAMQFENPNLRWCFPCSTLIPVLMSVENGEQRDALSEIVKMLKDPPSSRPSLDVEDVWFTGGSVTSEIKSENTVSSILEGRGGYVVRGLANLGNTCFFNSVLQNLLAMDKLRDFFSTLDGPAGPLTVSLKKFFSETSPALGVRNVVSPRSLFGCVCSKAPQFRGYQQHDSHELLRCLLDGLCTEESSARKQSISSKEDGNAPKPAPTFVDAIFGGQLSSTVSCLECGHTSIVYEPFLDLSLPLPTKRSPSKKAQSVSRAKKPKLPPKRSGRFRPKINRESEFSPAHSVSDLSTGGNTSHMQSIEPVAEKLAASAGDSSHLVSVARGTTGDNNGSAPQNLSARQGLETKQVAESTMEETAIQSDYSAGLDYLKPASVSNGHDPAPQLNDISMAQGSGNEAVQADVLLQLTMEPSKQVDSCTMKVTSPTPDDLSWLDYVVGDQEASRIDEESAVQESGNGNAAVQSVELLNHKSDLNNDMGHLGNSWEDESPVQVQGSEILLLPYKEVTSPTGDNEVTFSSIGDEQDSLDFGGFGDLFDEPEVSGPSLKPSSTTSEANGAAEIGFMESDPDEVDHTDSPVSVESCLAYFTKPELLAKIEHGWQCEQCSKALVEQRMRLKKERQKPASRVVSNGGEDRNPNAPSDSGTDCCPSVMVQNLSNGSKERDEPGSSVESLVLHNGKGDDGQSCIASGLVEGKSGINCGLPELSQSSCSFKTCCQESFSSQASDSCTANEPGSAGCEADKVQLLQQQESQLLSRPHESEGSEDEEIDSGSVKVTRDATKRILINRAPPILTIHLKRFSQDARGRLNKLNGHVNFRETIDLRPYINPSCIQRDKHKYRLVGVVEHLGTMRGGHYVAYVRGGAKSTGKAEKENEDSVWYHASDAYTREASLEEVLRCEAYILFYEEI